MEYLKELQRVFVQLGLVYLDRMQNGEGKMKQRDYRMAAEGLIQMNREAKPPVGRSEYGRIKVALPRGKGLMDWVRLSASKFLAKKRLPQVDNEELIKHNSLEDCWVHLYGQVYDVTSYLEFHPGGIPELMRAAGRDATPLFNQYHAWVNYDSMLKSCLVGRFSGDLTKLPPCGPSTIDETVITAPLVSDGFSQPTPSSANIGINIDIEADSILISSTDWTSLSEKNVVYHLDKGSSSLRVLIRHFNQPSCEIVYGSVKKSLFEAHINIEVKNNAVQLIFRNLQEELSHLIDNSERRIRNRPVVKYYNCSIEKVVKISHDTYIYHVVTPEGVHLPIPLGHHVSVKAKRGLVAMYRPYTPVGFTLPSENNPSGSLTFLIKIYPEGNFTQVLKNLIEGDKIEISDPIGDKNIPEWIGKSDVLLLAAGTGITPMIPIIESRLEIPELRTELFFFNKTKNDIVDDGWASFKWSDPRLQVHHVLSSSASDWNGLTGRINARHLPDFDDDTKVLICGPDGFIGTAVSILDSKGVPSSRIHIFKG